MNQSAIFSSRPRLMRSLLEAFVPATAALDEAAVQQSLAASDRLVADRPAAVKRQIVLAITVLRVLAFCRHLRGLVSLEVDKRRAFLESLQESRLLKLRLAVWGLRTLLFAGYYGDPHRHAELHYRPRPQGWDALNTGEAS